MKKLRDTLDGNIYYQNQLGKSEGSDDVITRVKGIMSISIPVLAGNK